MRSILKPLWTSHIIRTLTKSFGWENSMVITHVITTVINIHMSHLAACVPAAFHWKLVELLLTTTESEVFGFTAFGWKKAAAHLWASITEEGPTLTLAELDRWDLNTQTFESLTRWAEHSYIKRNSVVVTCWHGASTNTFILVTLTPTWISDF